MKNNNFILKITSIYYVLIAFVLFIILYGIGNSFEQYEYVDGFRYPKSNLMSTIISLVNILLLIYLGLVIYFIPSLIAYRKNHANINQIFILNLLLGWIFIGWVIALIWAYKKPEEKNESSKEEKSANLSTDLQEIKHLLDQKLITEEEFIVLKNKILSNKY